MDQKVSIILLNWNGWEDTIECLESIYQINYPNYNVIIVDNASRNDSILKIKKYAEGKIKVKSDFFDYNEKNKPIKIIEYTYKEAEDLKVTNISKKSQKTITIIKNDKNYGFTKGNNIGIRHALNIGANYLLLLNNDTVVDKNFLTELVKIAESDSSIGFTGPKTYYYKYGPSSLLKTFLSLRYYFNAYYKYPPHVEECKNIIQSTGGKENMWKGNSHLIGEMQIDKGQFDNDKTVDFIHGSCMLIKSRMIRDVGLLDEEFFSYREENDWCIRGYKKGWKSVYSCNSIIWHKNGGSTAKMGNASVTTYYMTRNRFLFMKKHATKWQRSFFLFYFFTYNLCFNLFIYAVRPFPQKSKVIRSFLRSIKDGLSCLN